MNAYLFGVDLNIGRCSVLDFYVFENDLESITFLNDENGVIVFKVVTANPTPEFFVSIWKYIGDYLCGKENQIQNIRRAIALSGGRPDLVKEVKKDEKRI